MTIAKVITEYWGFVMFLLGLSFHAIWTYFRVDNHEKRISKVEDDLEMINKTHTSIESRLSSIEAKLDILVNNFKQNDK